MKAKQAFIGKLIEIATSEGGIERMVNVIADDYKSYVYLTNLDFTYIAHGHYKEDLMAEEGHVLLSREDILQVEEALMKNNHRVVTVQRHQQQRVVVIKIMLNQQVTGYCMIESEDEMSKADIEEGFVTQWTNIVAYELMKFRTNHQKGSILKHDFVTTVLMGNISDTKEVMTLCDLSGFDYRLKWISIFIKPARFSENKEAEAYKQSLTLSTTVSRILRRYEVNSLKFNHQNNMVVFLFFSGDKDSMSLLALGEEIGEVIITENSQMTVTCGVGKVCSGIDQVGKSFRQSVKAITLGSRIHDDKFLFSYEQDRMYHVLNEGLSFGELQEFYEDTLYPLALFDEENNSDLMVTLKSYMACKFKTNDTAKVLHLHRNTLA